MTALAADRNTKVRNDKHYEYPVAAAKTCYMGAIIFLDASGNAEPATSATGKICVGRCKDKADNGTGAAAAINVKVEPGIFKWGNSGTNTLTKANIGDTVYAEDDQTVGSSGTGRSACGVLQQVDSDGVWVDTRRVPGTTGLLAANNLSDVLTVATARSNLGLDTGDSPTFTGLIVSAAATVGTTLGVTGAATLSSTLAVTGAATLSGGYNLGTNSPVRKFVRTSLSAAQIQTLNATPVQILAAAAGKIFVPVEAIYSYTHVANAYDDVGAGEDFRIQWKTGTVQAMPDLDTTTDINMGAAASDVCVIHADNAVKQKPVTNDDLEVTILVGEIYSAAGDGTMVIDLVYDEYTV